MENGHSNQLVPKEQAEVLTAAERAALQGQIMASSQELLAFVAIDLLNVKLTVIHTVLPSFLIFF